MKGFLIRSILLVVFAASSCYGQLDFGTLQSLKYRPTTGDPGLPLNSEEVATALQLFEAFSHQPPIDRSKIPSQTRGTTGISVFRNDSPAVALICVGTSDKVEGLGTGVIVDRRGYVLTNWHVVNGYASAVVFLKPSNSAEIDTNLGFGARVVYTDRISDLALLKLVRGPASVPALQIEDITAVQVAEDIHIIGHPKGELWSYSTGVISQIRPDYQWVYSDGSQHRTKVLQMQTAINPGNSGGPVLDDSGRIVGLVAMFAEGQNLDYAVASDVISQFVKTGLALGARGANPSTSIPQPANVDGAAAKDKRVVRVQTQAATEYWVFDSSGKAEELFVTGKGGSELHATGNGGSQGFEKWSYKADGREFVATGSNGLPQSFARTN